jgi:single-stranded-DNA-specific exonuclease
MNAAGRMDDARKVIELFFTKNPEEAAALAAELHDHNRDRRETEAAIVKAIQEECAHRPVTDCDAALVFSAREWHKGVVGIVASRVVETWHRPVFVLCEDPESGEASGSGRSIRGFHLLEALESMAGLFTKFGGHRQACGATLPIEKIPEFRRRFNEYASARLTPEDFRPVIDVDALVRVDELSEATVTDVCRLAPFGFGNPTPVFAIMNAEIAGASVRAERHVNLGIRQNGGRTMILTGWDWAGRLEQLRPGSRVNLAVTLDEGGQDGRWRIILKDVQPAVATASAD